MKVRTRIAPSPTGFPHIGTIYQSMIDYAWAKKNKGDFLVRIEDTDTARFVKEAENKIFEALDWFNIEESEGVRKGGKYEPYRQSERLDIYKKYAKELVEKDKAYYCFCTQERLKELRKKQQKQGKPPMYDKHCRNLTKQEVKQKLESEEKYVIRMKIPENKKIVVNDLIRGEIDFDSNTIDDQVILKSDGYPTYHLAVVVDDHLMKITHVIRGPEWIPSFPKHKLLYEYFEWDIPKFAHTPLITNKDGSKMSKRHEHANVDWYKNEGFLPEAVLNFLCLLGWSHPSEKEIFPFDEFIKHFELKDLSAVNPKFDLKKLEWMNGQYINDLSLDKFYSKVINYDPEFKEYKKEKFKKVLSLVQERARKLSEIKESIEYFYKDPNNFDEIKKMALKESKEDLKTTKEQIKKVIKSLQDVKAWNAENIDKALHNLMEKEEIKPRQFFMPIRIISTGRPFSPPIGDTLEVLGKESSIERLGKFLEV